MHPTSHVTRQWGNKGCGLGRVKSTPYPAPNTLPLSGWCPSALTSLSVWIQATWCTCQVSDALLIFSISKQHAILSCKDNEITIKPATQGAKTKVDGVPLTGERVIKHMDRILFGMKTTHFSNVQIVFMFELYCEGIVHLGFYLWDLNFMNYF